MGPVISGCMYPFKMLLDSTIWKDVLSIPCCPFPPSPFLCWYLPALSTPCRPCGVYPSISRPFISYPEIFAPSAPGGFDFKIT